MAYSFTSAQSLEWQLPVASYPYTMCVWINVPAAVTLHICGLGMPNPNGTNISASTVGPYPNGAFEWRSGYVGFGRTYGAVGTWWHLGMVLEAINSTWGYVDGVKGHVITSTTSGVGAGIRLVLNGGYHTGSWNYGVAAKFAEPCVWSAILTDAEVAALAKGISPRKIRPSAHCVLPDLRSSSVRDLRSGATTLWRGSPVLIENPRIYN